MSRTRDKYGERNLWWHRYVVFEAAGKKKKQEDVMSIARRRRCHSYVTKAVREI